MSGRARRGVRRRRFSWVPWGRGRSLCQSRQRGLLYTCAELKLKNKLIYIIISYSLLHLSARTPLSSSYYLWYLRVGVGWCCVSRAHLLWFPVAGAGTAKQDGTVRFRAKDFCCGRKWVCGGRSKRSGECCCCCVAGVVRVGALVVGAAVFRASMMYKIF